MRFFRKGWLIIADFKSIKKEIAGLPKASKELAEVLLLKAIFMDMKLEELQEDLREKPLTERYDNGGGQMGTKESTNIKIYNATIKNYTTVIKQLYAIISDSKADKPESDELIDFLKEKKAK